MSLGPLMLDLEGLQVSAVEKEILNHPLVGGVILFTRNYHSPEQLRILIREIRKATAKRLLVAVDQEGGRVQRFRESFTELPELRKFGKYYEQDSQAAITLSETCGWLMAAELLAFDIDISFAPVLDLDKGVSKVIGDRSFHHNTDVITILARAYIQGMQRAGMSATGKHFPGHGSVAADSHTHVPIDTRNLDEILSEDAKPFADLIQAGLSGIMPAHVIYEKIDKQPAGFSQFWLQEILRQRYGFKGVIFSDDLGMAGASVAGGFINRAKTALNAGCDMLLICNNQTAAVEVIDNLQYTISKESLERIQGMYSKGQKDYKDLFKMPAWQQAQQAILDFANK